MSLLGDVATHLERNEVPSALIGAAALISHGIARNTFDVDLVTVSRGVLSDAFWEPLRSSTGIEVRRGDFDDPLAGVVRLRRPGEKQVDVVVPKHKFVHDIVERAEPATVTGVRLRVVRLPDLVLLKLYAGGPQDAWDIDRVLATADVTLIPEVESRLPSLPEDARALWERLLAERRRPGG